MSVSIKLMFISLLVSILVRLAESIGEQCGPSTELALNGSCLEPRVCIDYRNCQPNEECRVKQCRCYFGHARNPEGECVPYLCNIDHDCHRLFDSVGDGIKCHPRRNQCYCPEGWHKGECKTKKVDNNDNLDNNNTATNNNMKRTCNTNLDCNPNEVCLSSVCNCQFGHVLDATGACSMFNCTHSHDCQAYFGKAYTCQPSTEGNSGQCKLVTSNVEQAQPSADCEAARDCPWNEYCHYRKCICSFGYKRDDIDGQCKPKCKSDRDCHLNGSGSVCNLVRQLCECPPGMIGEGRRCHAYAVWYGGDEAVLVYVFTSGLFTALGLIFVLFITVKLIEKCCRPSRCQHCAPKTSSPGDAVSNEPLLQ